MPDTLHDGSPRGRFTAAGSLGIIDIGSNSVRLVIYEREARFPTALFNEKVLAGLGRGVGETGRLSDKSVHTALEALVRFRALCDHVGVKKLSIIATAAARETENGPDFIAEVERICGVEVKILSGFDEAYYSAMGVRSGFWKPDGLVGDLGGGSLELVDINAHGLGEGHTYPLGGIRLQEAAGKSPEAAAKIASDILATAPWISQAAMRKFYAIGGTWRSLGRLHLFQERYPLHVMHDYAIPAEVAIDFCERVAFTPLSSQPKIEVVSKARRSLLPYGAVVLKEVLQRSGADQVVFSALGIREGLLFDNLSAEKQEQDPLLEAARELCVLRSRSPRYAQELMEWTEKILTIAGIEESETETRLRKAACYLSDIGWRAHPDYRGKQSLNVISNMGFIGINHSGRAYLALAVFYQHEGLIDEAVSPKIKGLCTPRLMRLARIIGASMRVASLVSASIDGVLLNATITVESDALVLALPEKLSALNGERLQKRLHQLAKILELRGEVRTRC